LAPSFLPVEKPMARMGAIAPPLRETPEEEAGVARIRAAPAVAMVAPEAVAPLQIRVALVAVVGAIAPPPIQLPEMEAAVAAPIRVALVAVVGAIAPPLIQLPEMEAVVAAPIRVALEAAVGAIAPPTRRPKTRRPTP
jgi:hypothetical protein